MATADEVSNLLQLVERLEETAAEQVDAIADQNLILSQQSKDLAAIKERLPEFVPKSRFRGAIAGVVLAGALVAFVGWQDSRQADEARKRDIANAEADQRRDRVIAAARGYSNCIATNRAFEGVDSGYSAVFAPAYARAADSPDELARLTEIHRNLRSGLARSDCDSLLVVLSPEDAELVRAEASRTLPTLPLPPPPLPIPQVPVP